MFGVASIFILGGFFVWQKMDASTSLARYAWERYHAAHIALALDKTDVNLANQIGSYYFGNQAKVQTNGENPYDLSLAKQAFSVAIAINPSLSLAHYMRARIEFIQKDSSQALADLNTELLLFPENKRVLYMRGLVYLYGEFPNNLEHAESDFREFSAWAPSEWAGYNDLAFTLAKEKKYAEATKVLKEGIKKAVGGNKNPWLYDALGVMKLNQNNYEDALSYLIKAQTLADSLTEADWRRAYPGNNPAFAKDGIEAMKVGIAKNIVTAYAALKKQ